MRNFILFLLIALFTSATLSAQVKIGDNPQNIDPSSVLELESTDKVLVITRVTTLQMNAIVPSQGALCFNTDLQSVHFYDGTQWVNVGGGGGTGGPLSADPIVNTQSTIVITPTATGDNLEVAPNSIRSEQIVDGGVNGIDIQDGSIGPGKIQDFSITQEKLSENSVGAFALDNDSFGVSAFNNDAGYITAGDINLVSGDVGNVLETRTDGVFYNDQSLITAINQNTDAIALDNDQSDTNEIQNISIVGQQLTIEGGNTITIPGGGTTADGSETVVTPGTNVTVTGIGTMASPYVINATGGGTADGSETIINPTASVTVTGTGTTLDPYELSAVGGGTGGTTEEVDGTTLTGIGTNADPFKIEPGATGQILTTDATGVVWANATPGGGSTEEADQTTITGVGTNADPFKIEPSPTSGQYLRTDAAGDVIWDDLPMGTGGSVASDGMTIVGDGADATTELKVPTGGITDLQILDGTILAQDLNQMGAAAGQVLIWDDLAGSWAPGANAGGGAAVETDLTLVGDGSSAASALGLADEAVTTGKILDANVTPIKIAPSLTFGQYLRTDATGNVIWDDLPAGTGGGVTADGLTITGTGADLASALSVPTDGITTTQIADGTVLAADLNDMGATDGQILKWDDATTSWVTAADDTGAGALTDGNIFVGDATNAPQDITLSGDATIDNLGALTIADDAITLPKIDQNGATDGQVLKWDDATTAWVTAADDNVAGTLTDGNIFVGDATDAPQDVTLSGDATIDNLGALTIADDAVTAAKIENATILAEDLNAMGATADGEILQWDTALNAGAGGWEVAPNAGHTGTSKSIFYAGVDGAPTQFFNPDNGEPSFYWDYEGRMAGPNSYGTLAIGLDGGTISNDVKVHIAEQLTAGGSLSYGLMLQNRTQGLGRGVGMIFSVDDFTTTYGKGALIFERTDTFARGDIHFLQSNATTTVNPTFADKAFTVTSNKDIGLYGGIDIGGAGTGFGTADQVLASDGLGNPVKWVDVSGHSGSAAGSIFFAGASPNFAPTDNNAQLFWDNTDTKLYVGPQVTTTGDVKLNVGGTTRTQGLKNSDGSAATPSYRFTDDLSSGMYSIDESELGFSAGGTKAITIDGTTAGATNVIINQSLELDGALLDKDGQPGTTGQVLSSTGGANPQTDWVTTSAISPIKAFGKISDSGINLNTSGASANRTSLGTYVVTLNTALPNDNYVVQLTAASNVIIFVISQTTTTFEVQITNATGTNFDANWYFTVIN